MRYSTKRMVLLFISFIFLLAMVACSAETSDNEGAVENQNTTLEETNKQDTDNSTENVSDIGLPDTFDETKFTGMTITYTETGSPIVDDPAATKESISQKGIILATTVNNIWVYDNEQLTNEQFIIPAGKTVIVLQTVESNAEITYAGLNVWLKCSELKLG